MTLLQYITNTEKTNTKLDLVELQAKLTQAPMGELKALHYYVSNRKDTYKIEKPLRMLIQALGNDV